MDEKLRACDCGAVDRLRVGAIEVDHSGYYLSSVNCSACRCAGPVVEVKGEEQAIASAIAAWNARPEEDALRARVNDLEDVLRSMLAQFEVYTSPFSKQFVNKSFTPDGQEVYILRTVQGKLREVIVHANNLLNAALDGRHE